MSSTYTKEVFTADPRRWAEQQFGECVLGDARRTHRLVDYAARQVAQPEASANAVCAGDDAVAEGTYRWLRNPAIDPKAVTEGPFRVTARICDSCAVVLAIQDTTTITYSHAVQKKRASRPARTSCMLVRAATVELARPARCNEGPESIRVSVVYLRERHTPKGEEPAEWLLLTTESIAGRRQVERIIGYYECRWLIEEFHKAWKSGCRIEFRRLQSLGSLERMMAVTATIAVRLLQIQALAKLRSTDSCTPILSTSQWQCLFAKMEPERPTPKRPPTIAWALEAIARLGGWRDTKRTGQVGWQTLWSGWAKLEELTEGCNLAARRS